MSNTTKACISLLVLLPALGCTRDDSPGDLPVQTSSGATETTGDVPIPTTTEEEAPGSSGDVAPDDTSTGEVVTSEAGDESSTTAPAEPVCGDGEIGGAEACDDGFAGNKLHASCLPNCVDARCGDGFVETGVEECDLGDGLNSYDYGGCLPGSCKWGPRCGDGDLDAPDEICDPGDPNGQGDGVVKCDADCRFAGRVVFISSQTYDGDFAGLAGADALCRQLAATFDKNHADDYVAWLSDANHSMLDRIAHGEAFANTPYVLRSGVPVAASFEALLAEGPSPGIQITETYESVSNVTVWTNTGKDGAHVSAANHCGNWGSNSGKLTAQVGKNHLPVDAPNIDDWKKYGEWTRWLAKYCDANHRIYCFENGDG